MALRLCLHWPQFGPYHLARLRAAQRELSTLGVDVFGLQTVEPADAPRGCVSNVSEGLHTAVPSSPLADLNTSRIQEAIVGALDRLRPDVLFINGYAAVDARTALMWTKENRSAAVIMFDSTQADVSRAYWREMIKRRIVSGFDAALVAGSRSSAYIVALGMPVDAVFAGVDVVDNGHFALGARAAPRDRSGLSSIHGLEGRTPYFLSVGRLVKPKNHSGLLAAYARYRSAIEDPWDLLIVGEGPLREDLLWQIRSEGLEGVTLAGRIGYADLPAYYRSAEAFVHPSTRETWGLVVNEAMAAGLPVLVSSQSGCSPDLVDHGRNGFVFDGRDTEGLARLLGILHHSEGREEMGRRSREIIRGFDLDGFATALSNASQVALSRRHQTGSRFSGMAVLRVIQLLARRQTSFQAIRD